MSYQETVKECLDHFNKGEFALADVVAQKLIKDHANKEYSFHVAGLVKKKQGYFREALKLMEKALEMNPDVVETRYNYANTLWSLGRNEDALAEYDKVLEARPEHTDAWLNKGRTLHQMGKNDEAAKMFKNGIKHDKGSGKCWENLLNTKDKIKKSEPDVEKAVKALKDIDPRTEEARCIHFALGRARLMQGKAEEAFGHYFLANRIARATFKYDAMKEARLLQTMARNFSPDLVSRLSGVGISYKRPIFIVGLPRSGTTLVEQIIAAHSRVMAGGERRDLEQALLAVKGRTHPNVQFLDWVPHMKPESCVDVGMAYQGLLPTEDEGTEFITDKMPGNFRFVGMIALALPNAKIIHVQRDPMDVCFSCFTHNFTNGHRYSFDQIDMGIYYQAYENLMKHWYEVLPKGKIYTLSYEKLVKNPEKEGKALLKYCDLDWEDACLKYYEGEKNIRTASMQQVRQPIYKDAIGRWKDHAPYLGPLIGSLGPYAPEEYRKPVKK